MSKKPVQSVYGTFSKGMKIVFFIGIAIVMIGLFLLFIKIHTDMLFVLATFPMLLLGFLLILSSILADAIKKIENKAGKSSPIKVLSYFILFALYGCIVGVIASPIFDIQIASSAGTILLHALVFMITAFLYLMQVIGYKMNQK